MKAAKKELLTKRESMPSIPSMAFVRRDYLAAGVAALLALALYIKTLAPSITGDDSGEFVTAAYTLGITHPPGYPLYCMLGKLFTGLVPFGSIASRVAFMSSFFGAATCFVVALIVIKLTASRLAAVASALALAVSLEFWKWNVVAPQSRCNGNACWRRKRRQRRSTNWSTSCL